MLGASGIGWQNQTVPYPEQLIANMRADLTQYGAEEARTPGGLDRGLKAEFPCQTAQTRPGELSRPILADALRSVVGYGANDA
jgi:hypothetical protein